MCRNTPSGMARTSTNYHIVEVFGIERSTTALMPAPTLLNRCEGSGLARWLNLSLTGRRAVCAKCTWCSPKNKARTELDLTAAFFFFSSVGKYLRYICHRLRYKLLRVIVRNQTGSFSFRTLQEINFSLVNVSSLLLAKCLRWRCDWLSHPPMEAHSLTYSPIFFFFFLFFTYFHCIRFLYICQGNSFKYSGSYPLLWKGSM